MQKIVLSAWLLATLVACGKDGADQYVGIWQDRKIGASEFGEIRKEGDQYLFEGSSNGKKWALYEKDGAWFTRNSYNPDEQLKLSSDGNTLFFDTTPVFRVKAGVCQELAKEYLSKKTSYIRGKVKMDTGSAIKTLEDILERYHAQCNGE